MATFTPNFPPSTFLRAKSGQDGEGPRRQTKEEYRKMKELEEGRKAGTVPAMTDIETGKDINPHIPHYIANAPWYVGSEGPTLKHQRPHPERQIDWAEITDNYKKGVTTKIATKFRKGACENCGSMTHKKKDCFERPRKVGAVFTGEDIAPDEYVPDELKQGYDAKRDRWNGFDPAEHQKVIDEYKRLEEARKIVKADQIEIREEASKVEAEAEGKLAETDGKAPSASEETVAGVEKTVPGVEKIEENVTEERDEDERDPDLDEDKYAEGADMPGVKLDVDSRTRITVRNLRIREDTAKYLYNLDPESAYYDPKSRAMRDNPFKTLGKGDDEVAFAGDNFKRFTGEVVDVNKIQLFAWDAHNRGVDVHVLAEPTKLEALKKEFETRKHTFKDSNVQAILDKYGGEEHLDAPPKELLLAQTEAYVEYNRKGNVVKGVERSVVRSKYEEDDYPNNHTSVWGSYWKGGEWGFKCCYSFVKNSYCTGEEGKKALEHSLEFADAKVFQKKNEDEKVADASSSGSSSSSSDDSSSSEESNEEDKLKKNVDRRNKRTEQNRKRRMKQKTAVAKKRKTNGDNDNGKQSRSESSSSSSDDDDTKGDAETEKKNKLRKALIEQAKHEREGEKLRLLDDRDRPYYSNYEVKELNDVELEAYKLRKIHTDDPMASYFNKSSKK